MMARWELRAIALGLGALVGLTACEDKAPQAPPAATSASTPRVETSEAGEVGESDPVLPPALELPEVERVQIKADAQATAKAEINEANAAQVLDELEAEIKADVDKDK